MKTDLEEVDEILRELEDTAHGREGKIITNARKILQKLISEPPPKDAEKELLRENQKALFSELKEANEYLTTLKVPTNGVDANGNLGYGKRENLTLKQRLTYLQLKNTPPKEDACPDQINYETEEDFMAACKAFKYSRSYQNPERNSNLRK